MRHYILFHPKAWQEYVGWQANRKVLKKINQLIKSISRDGYSRGMGKPEPLKGTKANAWSRRITSKHRLVYLIKNRQIIIITCKYHYRK